MKNIQYSKIGLSVALVYILISIYFGFRQGLFGESFVAFFLGLPWSFFLVFFDKFLPHSTLFHWFLYVIVLGPILNTVLLYWFGAGIEAWITGSKSRLRYFPILLVAVIFVGIIAWTILGDKAQEHLLDIRCGPANNYYCPDGYLCQPDPYPKPVNRIPNVCKKLN